MQKMHIPYLMISVVAKNATVQNIEDSTIRKFWIVQLFPKWKQFNI
jgi:hypothetical protein